MLKINTDEPFAHGSADIDISLYVDGVYHTETEMDNGMSATIMVHCDNYDDFSSGNRPIHILVNVRTGLESKEEHPSSKE